MVVFELIVAGVAALIYRRHRKKKQRRQWEAAHAAAMYTNALEAQQAAQTPHQLQGPGQRLALEQGGVPVAPVAATPHGYPDEYHIAGGHGAPTAPGAPLPPTRGAGGYGYNDGTGGGSLMPMGGGKGV
jgi:hypothetical protein